MKKKIFICFLSFLLVFSSVQSSFAYDKNRSAIALGSVVIAKETFNVIIGCATAMGITLLTYDDKVSFVDEFLHSYSLKVDSGDFSTSSEHLENEIKTHVKKPSGGNGGDNGNNFLSVGASLVALISSVFDFMFKDKPDVYTNDSSIPTGPNYLEVYSLRDAYKKDDIIKFNLPGADTFNFKHTGSNWEYKLDRFDNQDALYAGLRNVVYKKPCDISTCEGYKKKGYYHLYVSSVAFSVPGGQGRLVYSNDNSYSPCYYFSGSVDKTNYKPVDTFLNVSNDAVVGSNPNLKVDGNLDLSEKEEEKEEISVPSFPQFDSVDFGAFDFSSLGDLFKNLGNKFPFSIPKDLVNLVSSLKADPLVPQFEVPLNGEVLYLDFSLFSEWAIIIRTFIKIIFMYGLFFITKKVIL